MKKLFSRRIDQPTTGRPFTKSKMLQALADTFGSIANDADPPIEEADLRRRLDDPTGLTYGNWDRIPLMTVEHPPPSASAVKKSLACLDPTCTRVR